MRYRIMTVSLIAMVIAAMFQISLVSATSIVEWGADSSAWSKQVEGAEGQRQNVMGRVLQVYYVAPDGNDGNPGTEAQPFRTIGQGVGVARAGDTVYVREGTYYERVEIRNSGTADNPIVISAYPGERPVIDGQYQGGTWSKLVRIRGTWIVFDGIEVTRGHTGISVEGTHVTIRNVKSHHNIGTGIRVSGDYALVENSEIWWNSMQNEYGQAWLAGKDWGAGLAAGRYPRHVTLRNNIVYNNWGEGLIVFEGDHAVIENNVVYDNFAVQLYVANYSHAMVRRNLVYDTDDPDFSSRKAAAIGVCDEGYEPGMKSYHLTLVNNLAMGGSSPFRWSRQIAHTGLRDSLIAYNTFVNSHTNETFKITSGDHSNTRIENNLILEASSLSIASVPDDPELQFSNNLWSKTPEADASGPGDVVGNPQLTKSGVTDPGLLAPEWFKLLASSPAQDRAGVITEVREDFFGNTRQSKPDIGAIERHSSVIHLPMIWKN
jgi:parallel beta-helix repeat protein